MDVSTIKQHLIDCLSTVMNKGLDKADTKEMGEVIDMIKDLSEAEYYELMTHAKKMKDDGYSEGSMTRMDVGFDNRSGQRAASYSQPRMMAPYGMASQYDEDDMYDYPYGRQAAPKRQDNVYRGVRFNPNGGDGRFDMNGTVSSLKEMWSDADPNTRKELKMNLESLLSEMK